MKIHLIGKNLEDIRPLLEAHGMREAGDGEAAELVVAHGGDGTLLLAEQLHPGVLKLPIRDARTAPLCADHGYARQIAEFVGGRREISHLPKLAGSANGETLYGINDVFVHNLDRVGALRYRVWIDGELYANEVVGDGLGLSTVHGSTAYYRSITRSVFKVGLGLAFSNSTAEIDHLVIDEKSVVTVEIVRGPGLLVADNSPHAVELKKGDVVEMRKSELAAAICNLDNFMCTSCRLLRHPNRLDDRTFSAVVAGKSGGGLR